MTITDLDCCSIAGCPRPHDPYSILCTRHLTEWYEAQQRRAQEDPEQLEFPFDSGPIEGGRSEGGGRHLDPFDWSWPGLPDPEVD
jgi:hypothetical protein